MSERVTMPALGESVTEGTVTRWLKQVGDQVAVDEPLLEVSTDKVDTEIPSPVAGTVQEILVGEDETVPVGADLAVIGDGAAPSADDAGRPRTPAQDDGQQARASRPEQPEQATEPEPPSRGRGRARGRSRSPSRPPVHRAGARTRARTSRRPPPGAQGGSGEGTTVTMPALGESVTEGTVTRWLKAEGDSVEVDEPLLEVSTDKVDTEIPSPVAGVVQKILVGEDETVPVGAELAVVGSGSASSTAATQTDNAPAAAAEPEPQPEPEPEAPAEPEPMPQPEPEPAARAEPAPAPAPAPEPSPLRRRPRLPRLRRPRQRRLPPPTRSAATRRPT